MSGSESVSTQLVHLVEPDGRPRVASLSVKLGDDVYVWALADSLDGETGLRVTVLRREHEDPPPLAVLVMVLESVQARSGLGFRVLRTGPQVVVELIRPDARTRINTSSELRQGTRFEAVLPNQRRVAFSVELASQDVQAARAAIGGSGTTRSQALQAHKGILWVVPSAWTVLTDPDDSFKEVLYAIGKRFNISARTFAWLTGAFFVLLGAGTSWYGEYTARMEAESAAEAARTAADDAEAARAVAVQAEAACMTDRQSLVAELGALELERGLAVETALAGSASRSIAVEVGGRRFGDKDVLKVDDTIRPVAQRLALDLLDKDRSVVSEADTCLAFERELADDLPAYALLWHTDPALACPPRYAAVVEGVSAVGRWGLSARVSREFGVADQAIPGGIEDPDPQRDPRMYDRWAAQTHAVALRALQTALLRYGGARPSVAPSQAQLWSLALYGAYSQMPSPAGGALDEPAATCITELLDGLAASDGAAAPGEPLLPDIATVATGEAAIVARPTPGCPWPADAIKRGAGTALTAVVRTAGLRLAPPGE
jgi:hypothetical protein